LDTRERFGYWCRRWRFGCREGREREKEVDELTRRWSDIQLNGDAMGRRKRQAWAGALGTGCVTLYERVGGSCRTLPFRAPPRRPDAQGWGGGPAWLSWLSASHIAAASDANGPSWLTDVHFWSNPCLLLLPVRLVFALVTRQPISARRGKADFRWITRPLAPRCICCRCARRSPVRSKCGLVCQLPAQRASG